MNQIKKYIKKQPYKVERVKYDDGEKEYVVRFTNPKFSSVIGGGKRKRQAVRVVRGCLADWLDWHNSQSKENNKK